MLIILDRYSYIIISAKYVTVIIMKTKKIKVKGSHYWKNGKKHTIKPHTRIVKDDTKTVSKKEYSNKFKKRPKTEQKKDLKRRSKGALKGTKNKLSQNWDTKKYDWVGVDAKKYPTIKKSQVIRELKGPIPNGYKIIKYFVMGKNKRKLSRYRPVYKRTPIGTINPYTNLKDAQNVCKMHHGRITGKVRNVNREEEFLRGKHKTRKYDVRFEMGSQAWKTERDSAYDDEMEDDHGISYSERLKERKYKRSMAGYDVYGRGY